MSNGTRFHMFYIASHYFQHAYHTQASNDINWGMTVARLRSLIYFSIVGSRGCGSAIIVKNYKSDQTTKTEVSVI